MLLGLSTAAFANITAVLNILPILAGLNALLYPASGLAALGFPVPTDPRAQRLSESLVRIYGVRQAAMGISVFALWWAGQHQLMGVLIAVNSPVAIADGLVSRWQTGRGEWWHWGFVPLAWVLAAGLLGPKQDPPSSVRIPPDGDFGNLW